MKLGERPRTSIAAIEVWRWVEPLGLWRTKGAMDTSASRLLPDYGSGRYRDYLADGVATFILARWLQVELARLTGRDSPNGMLRINLSSELGRAVRVAAEDSSDRIVTSTMSLSLPDDLVSVLREINTITNPRKAAHHG